MVTKSFLVIGGLLAAITAALAVTLVPAAAQNSGIPAVGAGESEDSHQNFPPENVIDGDLGTRWASPGDNRNIYVDLGSVHRIDDVRIAWFRGDTRTSDFNIYAREGTSGSWNEVFSGTSSGDTEGLENYNVDDADARFVRVEVESNSAGADFQNISEIEVIGTGGAASSPAPSDDPDPAPEPESEPDDQDDNNDSSFGIVNSSSANRSNANNLDGDDIDGNLYAFVSPDDGISNVQFFLDGSFVKQENFAPYDLQGGDGDAQPFNTNQISNGSHTLAAVITLDNGSIETVSADFDVDNGGASPAPQPDPDPEPEPEPEPAPELEPELVPEPAPELEPELVPDNDDDDNDDNDDNQPSGNIGPNGSFTAVDVGTFESSRSGFPAENAIDGNLDTRWSSQGQDRDIYVDLGGVARIDDVGIAFHDGHERISEFTIYVRTGTSGSWNEVFEGESGGETSGIEIFNVSDADARFVRIEVESNDFNDIQNTVSYTHL